MSPRARALRLVPADTDAGARTGGSPASEGLAPHILIVAARADERRLVREELMLALASGTTYGEADNVWGVLREAQRSSVVMLAGELGDVSAVTLTELLARRHPWLPVVVLEGGTAERPESAAS